MCASIRFQIFDLFYCFGFLVWMEKYIYIYISLTTYFHFYFLERAGKGEKEREKYQFVVPLIDAFMINSYSILIVYP